MPYRKRGRKPAAAGKRVRYKVKHVPISAMVVPGYTRRAGYYRSSRYTGEKKFFDTTLAFTAMQGSGTVLNNSLNLIDQGNGENEMIGRKAVVKSIQLKGRIRMPRHQNPTLGNMLDGGIYRMYLVLDKQANGAAATVSDVFQQTDPNGMFEIANKDRFSIVKKWEGSVVPMAGGHVL